MKNKIIYLSILLGSMLFAGEIKRNNQIYIEGYINKNFPVKTAIVDANIRISTKLNKNLKIIKQENKILKILNNKCSIDNSNLFPLYKHTKSNERILKGYTTNYRISCNKINKQVLYNSLSNLSKKGFIINVNYLKPDYNDTSVGKLYKKFLNNELKKIRENINKIEKSTNKICFLKLLDANYKIKDNGIFPYRFQPLLVRSVNLLGRTNSNRLLNVKRFQNFINIKIKYKYFCVNE